jgi:hypothetical protein
MAPRRYLKAVGFQLHRTDRDPFERPRTRFEACRVKGKSHAHPRPAATIATLRPLPW